MITKCFTKVKASYEEISNKGNDLSKKIDKIDVNINDKSIYEKRKEYINFLNSSSSKFYGILQDFVKEYKTYYDEYGNYHKEYIVKEKNKDIITKCKKLNEYKTIFINLSKKIELISKEIDNIKLHIEVKENELLKDINNNFIIMKKKVAYISALENIIEEIILPNKELFGLGSLKFLFDNKKDKNNKNTEKVDNRYEELSNKMKEKFGKPLKDINEIDVYETVGKLYNEITYNISDIYQATTMSKIEKIMNYSSYIFSIGKKEKITIAEKKLYDPIKSIEVPNNLTIGGIKSFVTSTFQIFDDFVKLIEDDIKTNENKSRSLLVDIGTKISKYKKSQTDYLENIKVKINESKENLREFVKTFIEVFDYVTKNNFPINGNDYEDYKSLCEILEKKSKETDDIFEILTDKEIYRNDEDLIVLACDTIKNVEFIEKFFDDVLFYFYDVRTKIYKKINEENNKEVKIKKKEDFMKYFENNQINLEYFKNLYEKMNEELKKYNIV